MDSYSVDFKLITDTKVPGIALVMPMNTEAYDFLTEEADMHTLNDGSAPMAGEMLADFVDDAEQAHLICEVG